MSAAEIIEEINALPARERAQVVRYVQQLDDGSESGAERKSNPAAREAAAKHIFDHYDDLFKKLAQ